MSNNQFDSDSSETDIKMKKIRDVSMKLNQLQDLTDSLIIAVSIQSRQIAISNLCEFLSKWRKEVNVVKCKCHKGAYSFNKKNSNLEENRSKLAAISPVTFILSRLFGSSDKGTSKMAAKRKEIADDESSTISSSSMCYSQKSVSMQPMGWGDSQAFSKTEYSITFETDPINIPSESSDHDRNCPSISHSMAIDDEENQEEFVPSLKLMTCTCISKGDDQPSMVAKSANIPGYESEKSYESYRLQTVNEMPQVHESDTFYSTGAVSSCQMSATVQTSPKDDDALATHYDPQIFNGQDVNAIIAQRVKALLTNDSQYELDGDDLGVEILEIAPLTENDSQMDAAGTVSQREEIESLKSKNGGFVRQMINAFSRFKN